MSLINYPGFLSKEHIQNEAEKVLEQMRGKPRYLPKFPLDPSRVAEFLGLDIVWDTIPADDRGIIAARILPLNKLIEINDSIPELRYGFGNSTIAHEVGHWVLHVNHCELEKSIKQQLSGIDSVDVQPFLCRSTKINEAIEWQAQYFASCLLMPHYILEDLAHGRKLTAWKHLYAMAEDLGVTISNLTNRLQDIGWIKLSQDTKIIYLGKNTPAKKAK